MAWRWLQRNIINTLHDQVVAEFGGRAGIRDEGLLESALMRPQNHVYYTQEKDPFKLATMYAEAIIRDHPFYDANKRTGFVAAYTFLGINGWKLEATEDAVVKNVVALAEQSDARANFAAWLQQSSTKQDPEVLHFFRQSKKLTGELVIKKGHPSNPLGVSVGVAAPAPDAVTLKRGGKRSLVTASPPA